uniref:Ubiquitin specific peptidase 8 n=1 Tax=Panthera tigris altaica TaxID=74533 RepID=A0A8C9J082_PANTA
MPAVASVPKELYLSSSLKDLNKKTEVKPEKISTKKTTFIQYLDLQTSKKLLKKLKDSLKALNS